MMPQLGLRCLLLLSMVLAVASRRGRLIVLKQNVTPAKEVVTAAAAHGGKSVVTRKEIPVYKACGGNINNVPEGIIEYPGDGEWYTSNSRCTWRITVKPGDRIAVNFAWFHTRNCDDKLLIKNGQNGSKIGQYCGKKTIPPFVTKANELYLYFYSNGALNYKGFNMTWRLKTGNEVSEEINQCISENGEASSLWNKVDVTGAAILSAVTEANKNSTREMELKIHILQLQLHVMKQDQEQTLKDMKVVNSKLDSVLKHLGSCQQPQPTTKQPISTKTTTPETPAGPRGCTCGIPNGSKRIIGGQAVVPNKYPWHVGLYSISEAYDYYCGGTIINTLYVLIAAHCVYPTYPRDLVVGVGDHNQTETLSEFRKYSGLTEHIPVLKVFVHHFYDEETLDYDIGMVKLTSPLEFTDGFGIRPICLPNDAANTYENEMGVILGWGATNYTDHWGGFDFPHVLQEAEVKVLAPHCKGVYENLTTTMICAASPGKDACSGDSGGSLAVSKFGQYTQIGITSWGYGCASENYPGVYSRITSFLPWIIDLSSDGGFCPASNNPNPSPKPNIPTTPPPSIEPPAGPISTKTTTQETPAGPRGCTCGIPNHSKRIIGGQAVVPNKYPWHVGLYSIYEDYDYYCGGTIINTLYVLIAAHCVYPTYPSDLVIGVGDHNQTATLNEFRNHSGLTEHIPVLEIYTHNRYDDETLDYDIGVAKLTRPIEFTDGFGIRPICLPKDDANNYVNEMGVILGWGATDYNYDYGGFDFPHVLQEAKVKVLPPNCRGAYENITSRMICAASRGKDACSGDSGGSLAVSKFGQYTQIGITSWGYGCALKKYPGVYSRITFFLPWINYLTSDGEFCSPSYNPNQSTKPNTPTTPPPSSVCKCGVPNYPKRIIMGDPVDPHKYPWHVGLYVNSRFKYFCGGTIINSLFVLTAAHCIEPDDTDDIMVGIGDHNRVTYSDDIAITQYVRVARAFRHKSYNYITTDYDFGLLKLSKHIKFNDELGIRPVCLPNDDNSIYVNEMAKILGWGKTKANDEDSFPNILQEADVVIYNPACNNTYSRYEITNRMLCAASVGVDACSGDSGGSLAVFEGGQYFQVGITSWGNSCAHKMFPGVYSRVTAVLDWIKNIAKEGTYC